MTFEHLQINFSHISFNKILFKEKATRKTCECFIRQNRPHLGFTITDGQVFELDIDNSLSECSFSEWDSEPNAEEIVELKITVPNIPPWLSRYSSEPAGCLQHIRLLIKVTASEAIYDKFLANICSIVTPTRWKTLEKKDALLLWLQTSDSPSNQTVKAVKIDSPDFQNFSKKDFDRLNDDKQWLSDTHINFVLIDWFQACKKEETWGNLKIQLLDTTFWSMLSKSPNKFDVKWREKENLLEYDYVIMPMFEENHWRLGIIAKPGEFLQGNTEFHILDSMRNNSGADKEGKLLQNIFLKYFDGRKYKKGCISSRFAEVPKQPNSNDCGCFLIYFAKRFLSNPESTMTTIQKTSFKNNDLMLEWGLQNNDLSFVRRQMRNLLYKYLAQRNATMELKIK